MRRAGALMAVACLGATAPDSSPVDQLAGRYGRHFINGLMDGTRYWSDDVVEIVPVDARHAYARLRLEYGNGHQCALSGIVAVEGVSLVYHEPGDGAGGHCRLSIRHDGAALRLDDGDRSCWAYCGARGTLSIISLPWKSRRPITYLPRLKASREYAEAVAAWRKTKDRQ